MSSKLSSDSFFILPIVYTWITHLYIFITTYIVIKYIYIVIIYIFLILTQGHFSLLLEKEGKGKRKGKRETSMRERSIDRLPPICSPTGCTAWPKSGIGDQTHNLGMCPDWESNLQPFGYGKMLQPTEPHWPGPFILFTYTYLPIFSEGPIKKLACFIIEM